MKKKSDNLWKEIMNDGRRKRSKDWPSANWMDRTKRELSRVRKTKSSKKK